jgi:tetratricopeptide (TPR) repeat protein
MTRSLSLLAGLFLVGVTIATPAHAQADASDETMEVSRRYFSEGEKFFALGRFAEALAQYQRAFAAKPIPALLFNIGQCQRNLGDYDAALFSFRKYLQLEPATPNREQILDYIDDVEKEAERARVRRLELDRPRPLPKPKKSGKALWWIVGGTALVAGGAITAFLLTRGEDLPSTTLGNIDFDR